MSNVFCAVGTPNYPEMVTAGQEVCRATSALWWSIEHLNRYLREHSDRDPARDSLYYKMCEAIRRAWEFLKRVGDAFVALLPTWNPEEER
jgi:hypothetical protein